MNTSFIPAYKVQIPGYLSLNAIVTAFLEGEETTGNKATTFFAYTPLMLEAVWEMASMPFTEHEIYVESVPFDICGDGEWLEEPMYA